MNNPNLKAWLGLMFVFLAIGLLLFITAGTVDYWQAWIYLSFFSDFFFHYPISYEKDPALLARRVSGGPTSRKKKS